MTVCVCVRLCVYVCMRVPLSVCVCVGESQIEATKTTFSYKFAVLSE